MGYPSSEGQGWVQGHVCGLILVLTGTSWWSKRRTPSLPAPVMLKLDSANFHTQIAGHFSPGLEPKG